MRLAQSACVSSAVPVSRKQLLDSLDELCPRDMQRICKFKNRCKRRAVFAALKKANVLGMVAALECEGFLRQFAFVAQLKKGPCECSLFPRIRFGSGCHAQHGVCDQSDNSSTKYSIHFVTKTLRPARPLPSSTLEEVPTELGGLSWLRPKTNWWPCSYPLSPSKPHRRRSNGYLMHGRSNATAVRFQTPVLLRLGSYDKKAATDIKVCTVGFLGAPPE